ncbi:hypothetical protein ATO12_15370 [Aquimarina atlantica]|uniref:Uncharacterized protein n=1 Tax=Aquimarina atlantica TaxID=1317122 RepID=A0A023BWB9_9FLAO|nr:hypothetical protein [Aquimarina atlantica]EZH74244.1 hypothetical protein ATO12_15370 [Aquimarina atlantica]
MDTISSIIKKAQDDLFPELEKKIRLELQKKDKNWLIDQIIYLTCERHSLHEQKNRLEDMKKRLDRIHKVGYDDRALMNFVDKYRKISREYLEESRFLMQPPHMGLATIEPHQRSKKGEILLEEARDMLYLTLYGDTTINVNLTRGQEEVLTIILPLSKSDSLFFLKAVTEVNADGTWSDPEGVSNDDHTNNVGLQVEFSDHKKGSIGMAIFVALNLINLLHVNEQIFYARMEKVERSSLQSL